VRGAEHKGLKLVTVSGFESLTGAGVTGVVDGHTVALGNLNLFEHQSVDPTDLPSIAEPARSQGQTVMYVAIDGKAAGLLGVSDPVKASTPQAVHDLHADGVEMVMLTGDNRSTATAVASTLGIGAEGRDYRATSGRGAYCRHGG